MFPVILKPATCIVNVIIPRQCTVSHFGTHPNIFLPFTFWNIGKKWKLCCLSSLTWVSFSIKKNKWLISRGWTKDTCLLFITIVYSLHSILINDMILFFTGLHLFMSKLAAVFDNVTITVKWLLHPFQGNLTCTMNAGDGHTIEPYSPVKWAKCCVLTMNTRSL